jgi:HAD superfamily hydrolase (TIGR01549 family)
LDLIAMTMCLRDFLRIRPNPSFRKSGKSQEFKTPDGSLCYRSCYAFWVPTRRKLTAVIFDWDGTLLDSYHADSQAYLSMFRELGVSWGLPELDLHYSPDWYNVYRAAGIGEAQWTEADQLWRTFYREHRPKLMKDTRKVLRRLAARYRMGLVTSGDRQRVERQLRDFAMLRLFRSRVCGGETTRNKPDPGPLLAVLKKMRVTSEECVYVGDTPEDLAMSRAAGVRAIAVLGPFPTETRLRAAKPEFLLDRLGELPGLLRKLYGISRR